MAADVDQIDGQMIVIDPVILERIAAELRGGDEPPVGQDRAARPRLGQERAHVPGRLGDVERQLVEDGLEQLSVLAERVLR